jgi:hypothetical protein
MTVGCLIKVFTFFIVSNDIGFSGVFFSGYCFWVY